MLERKTTLEILEEARDLIRDPGCWCQGSPHQDGADCAWGALLRVEGAKPVQEDAFSPAIHALSKQLDYDPLNPLGPVACFNDSHTHAEVLELFNLAIAAELAKTKTETRELVAA